MHHAPAVVWRMTAPCLRASSGFVQNVKSPSYIRDIWRLSGLFIGVVPNQRAYSSSSKPPISWLPERPGEAVIKSHHSHTFKHIGAPVLASPSSRSTQTRVLNSRGSRHEYSTDTHEFGRLSETEYRRHPSKFKPLSREGIQRALGPGISRELGNRLLETLQKQRITGTLDHPIGHDGVDGKLLGRGLLWLRANYPIDEDAAIIKRIEDEERQLEAQFVADAERFKIYKPQERAKDEGVYGKSQLEAIRKEREEQLGVQQQADEIRNAASDSAIIQHPKGRAVLVRRAESAEWVERYKKKAALSDLLEPENISKSKRLLPSAIFVVVIVGLCVVFANNYKPPGRNARIWPDIPPAAATALALLGLNVAAFFMWRMPFLWRFMNQNFLLIPATPKVLSLLGNTFSHHSPTHLLMNMAFLWFIGTKLHDQIGRGNFLALYLSCGVFASFVSLSRFVLSNSLLQTSLGASGAMSGIVAAWLAYNSSSEFTIAFIPEDMSPKYSSSFALACLFVFEIFGAYRGVTRIDHWAHMGGYAAGIAGAKILKHRTKKRIQAEKARERKWSWW